MSIWSSAVIFRIVFEMSGSGRGQFRDTNGSFWHKCRAAFNEKAAISYVGDIRGTLYLFLTAS